MPIAEACTLVDASLEHEACACTGRGAEARTYTPLVSRVVITLIAASFGDGLLHLGLASVTLRFKTKSGAVMHNNANYQHR